MQTSRGDVRLRAPYGVLLVTVVSVLVYAAPTSTQGRESLAVTLPSGPAKNGFDIKRFSNFGNGWFETFYVEKTEPLQAVLKAGRVAGNTRLLVFQTAAGRLALINDQMSFHHIAQGRAGGKDWMATFWVVCNSGTSLVPTINGTMHHFDNVGLYDALFIMQDKETKTLWNHITGEALYGPMVGRRLGPAGNLLQMSVEQALAVDAAIPVAISDRPYMVNGRQFGSDGAITGGPSRAGTGGPAEDRTLSNAFVQTLGTEDTRLPRMELGLGIVTDRTVRFYPMAVIQERGALIDEIDGRKMLLFVDQATFTPAALYVNASRATVQGRDVRLDTGAVVRMGSLFDARGARVDAERPQQLFSRWYGFSLTFPRPEIFGR